MVKKVTCILIALMIMVGCSKNGVDTPSYKEPSITYKEIEQSFQNEASSLFGSRAKEIADSTDIVEIHKDLTDELKGVPKEYFIENWPNYIDLGPEIAVWNFDNSTAELFKEINTVAGPELTIYFNNGVVSQAEYSGKWNGMYKPPIEKVESNHPNTTYYSGWSGWEQDSYRMEQHKGEPYAELWDGTIVY